MIDRTAVVNSALASGAEVEAAIADVPSGIGAKVVEYLRELVGRHNSSSLTRVDVAQGAALVAHVDALRSLARRLAIEVHFFRDNRQLGRDAAAPRTETCENCRWFDAVKSTNGHIAVDQQAIVMEAGVCCYAPPIAVVRPGTPVTESFFPPVHPSRWCVRWEDRHS